MKRIVAVGLIWMMVLTSVCMAMSKEPDRDKDADYVGTWLRIEKYANGNSIPVNETATLILTRNAFASDSKGIPGAECNNSGKLTVRGKTMTMTVTASTCPSIITVGSVVKQTYTVSADKSVLTIVNTQWGYTYKEVLRRQ
jgi:hypothetical protein